MPVPENRRAQKRATADSVVVGDWIYHAAKADPTAPAGDYLMIVSSIGRGTYEGIDVYLLRGDVYEVAREGSQRIFLGELHPHLVATAREWKLPLDGTIFKGCPLEEADGLDEWGLTPES